MKHLSRTHSYLDEFNVKVSFTESELDDFFKRRPKCRGRMFSIFGTKEWMDIFESKYYIKIRSMAMGTRYENLYLSKEKTTEGLELGWKKMILQKSIQQLDLSDEAVFEVMRENPFEDFIEKEFEKDKRRILIEKAEEVKALPDNVLI